MEHTQKMVLVPQEQIVGRVATTNPPAAWMPSSQTPGTQLSRLDAEMSKILRNNGIDDSEKWEKYCQVLQRYLHFVHRELPAVESSSLFKRDVARLRQQQQHQKTSGQNEVMTLEAIVATVPERYKRKATKLLMKLQELPDRISWDHQGTVTIEKSKIGDSSIVDLINEAMRERKKVTANIVGRRQFAQILHKGSVPRELVGNEKLWREGASVASPNRLAVPRTRQESISESSAPSVRHSTYRETSEGDDGSVVLSSDDESDFFDPEESLINVLDAAGPSQTGKGLGKRKSPGGRALIKWAKLKLRKRS